MIFVFDLDDTICDTNGYSEFYISKFFKDNNWPYKQITKIGRYAEMLFNWDHDTAWKWYKEFGDEMALHFPIKPNAKEVINALYDNGHTIIIATARTNDWHTKPYEITTKWLKDNKIKYHKLYYGRVDKEAICEEVDADFFIDDDIGIVTRVNDYFKSTNQPHKQAFLTTSLYNEKLDITKDVIRIKDFNEFEQVIENIINTKKQVL